MSAAPSLIAPKELVSALETIAVPLLRPAGSLLFERGHPAKGIFLIRKGSVALQLDGAVDVFPMRLLGPGTILGLPATLSGETYSLTAVTKTECQVGYISKGIAVDFLRANSDLCFLAMQVLSEEISGMRSAIARASHEEHNIN